MIISCPNCSEKYFVDSRNLKKKGIKLKCSSCNYTWFYNSKLELKIKNKEEKKISYTPNLPKNDLINFMPSSVVSKGNLGMFILIKSFFITLFE